MTILPISAARSMEGIEAIDARRSVKDVDPSHRIGPEEERRLLMR